MEDNKCIVCGNEKKHKKAKTCSRECANVLKRQKAYEIRKCVECGTEFEIRKKLPNKLCSDECRDTWTKRPENIKKRINASRESYFKKTGAYSVFEDESRREEVKEKSKEGIERIGKKEFSRRSKETKKRRYGDENFNNHDQILQTKKERYDDQNYNNRKKAEQTMLDKYGASHAMKNDDIQQKARDTLFERSGYYFPLQNPELLKSMQIGNIEKYGFKNVSQNPEIKEKVRSWYFDRFTSTSIFSMLENSDITLLDEYEGLRRKLKKGSVEYVVYNFKCEKCGHKFRSTFLNHTIPVCRKCYPVYKNNALHQEFFDFLKGLNIDFFDNDRELITPFELDFYCPDHYVAFEINGNYCHSERGGGKNRDYHINKTNMCFEEGVKLIHIFEDEWLFKKEIVKSMIRHIFGKTEKKIYGRLCDIEKVEKQEAIQFLEDNHIMGSCAFDFVFGLKHKDQLVSVMVFRQKKNYVELSRFCSVKNTNVIGGFSKLLSNVKKDFVGSTIKTYADCRWSGINPENTVYIKNGFLFVNQIKPRYWYFKPGNYLRRYHRFSFNKKKLIKLYEEKYESWMTEWNLACSVKMDRIWDCGNLVFEMEL